MEKLPKDPFNCQVLRIKSARIKMQLWAGVNLKNRWIVGVRGLQMVGSLDDNQLSARARGVKAHSSSCTWAQRIVRITCTRHGNIKSISFTRDLPRRIESWRGSGCLRFFLCNNRRAIPLSRTRGFRAKWRIISHLEYEIFVDRVRDILWNFIGWFCCFVAFSLNDIIFQERYVEIFQFLNKLEIGVGILIILWIIYCWNETLICVNLILE